VNHSLPRSLSAVTRCVVARVRGFDLAHHTVFFSDDYPAEFEALFGRAEIPAAPTVYICAQDRTAVDAPVGPERLLILVNAPARADRRAITPEELVACRTATDDVLRRGELELVDADEVATTPDDFAALFPGTAGALYGAASHGMAAAFRRPGARTRIANLALAGGAVHPGAGVPMACLSGRLAAQVVAADLGSTPP
jgi:1-hydroxycarotenoid 3,4-desaturase